jgi:hypothetical protein
MGASEFVVPHEQLRQVSVLVELDRVHMTGHMTALRVGVYSGGKRLETVKTSFIGPR